jgi:hypothetical protein
LETTLKKGGFVLFRLVKKDNQLALHVSKNMRMARKIGTNFLPNASANDGWRIFGTVQKNEP